MNEENSLKIRKTFKKCIVLLQNSVTIEEFSKNLCDTFNLFCLKAQKKETLNNIRESFNKRLLRESTNEILAFYSFENEISVETRHSKNNRIYIENNFEYNITKNSKYSLYFSDLIDDLSK